MKKRLFCLLLVCVMVFGMMPMVQVGAVTTSSYSPYAKIDYAYSSSVTCGTVRYISQVSSDSYFYSSYWPSSTFGYYTGPSVECGTASISMALSYIGVNKTPNDILSANNGATSFSTGWGGSTYYSYSASNLSGAMDAYINGNGKYSPPVIHIPGYSAAGHYVVVVGKISSGVYQILDPWQRALTRMTVSGSSATYTVYGSTIYDTIDQIHQWYNGSASLDYASGCTSYASYCQIKASKATVVNTQPCSAGSNGSTTIENAASGATYTAIKLFKNTGGNLWYQVTTSSGKVGYMYAGHVTYVKALTSDITVSGASAPNGHVAGSGYYINGTVSSKYNELTNVALYVHSGFGTSGTKKIGYSDTASGNSYALLYSNIDSNTLFGSLTAGKYTYAIYASYKNYYATNATTLASKTGTLTLMDDYFVVIASSVSQSSCSHSYSTTTISAATCTASGSQVKSCSKCGLISESTTAATGHSYGSWTIVEATCTTAGSKTRTCANCGNTESQTTAASGHDYTMTVTQPDCKHYMSYCYTCGNCGDSYTVTAQELTSQWIEAIPEGMDASQFNTKTQYRYADYETTTSYETSLEGYTQDSSTWVQSGTKTVEYVNSWPSGFSTSNSLYTKYNKKSSKVTASETATTKTVINSDAVAGYLWYHWCYANSYYSVATSSGSYTTFHAFYSTSLSYTDYDTSDGSYENANSSVCTNGDWYWYTTVYAQKSTSYKKQFTYGRWGEFGDWSDTVATASDTRKVETRTLYQLKEAALGDHSYTSKVTAPTCTAAGYTTYTCTVCGDSYTGNTTAATSHSYSSVVTAPTCTTSGYTTFTCVNCGDSYTNNVVSARHSYSSVVTAPTCTAAGYTTYSCSLCGDSFTSNTIAATGHSYSASTTNPTCTTAGKTVYTCGNCGGSYAEPIAALGHSYVSGTCSRCGTAEPSAVVKPTMSVTGASVSFESEVLYNIYYTVDDASSIVEMGLVTFTEKLADGTHANAVDVIPGYVSGGGEYMVHTNGIPAKNMGDAVYFRIYAKLTDGSYVYGDVAGYHAVAYAKSILAKSDSAEMKALVVAMVNYGAQAQQYFGYNTGSLMNSFLTTAQQALVSAYNSTMINSVVSCSTAMGTNFPRTAAAFGMSTSVSFEGAFSVNYYFTANYPVDDGMTMYWWDAETYNSASVLTRANACGTVSLVANGSEYWGQVGGIAAKEIDQTIYVCAVYKSGGVEYTTGVRAYSLGYYCQNKAAGTSAIKDFAAATAVYGYYAKQYFASIA